MTELVPVDRVRNHWYRRPGWRTGRRFFTWHLTFKDQPALHTLVDAYQDAIADLPGLDLIPSRWLHLTMQGVGFTDDVDPQQVDDIAAAVRVRLVDVPVPVVTFHRPMVIAESVVLPPIPREPIDAVRTAIRAGIADIWGRNRVPDPVESFRPHLSLAYFNTEASAAPLIRSLDGTDPHQITLTIPDASLIVLRRDGHLYRWQTRATAAIG